MVGKVLYNYVSSQTVIITIMMIIIIIIIIVISVLSKGFPEQGESTFNPSYAH